MELKRYLSEAELALSQPSVGDEFDITVNEVFNLETEVLESNEDGITLAIDDRGIAILEELGAFNEEMDKSSGSPYDRGGADAYYGRKFNPHKMVPNPEDPRGRIQQTVTDPDEIAAYKAGWNDEDGRKDYGESVDDIEAPVTEDEHIVQHKTHGAVYGKDGKAKLFMTRSEATAVADEMAKKHGSSGVSVVQGPYTGYMVKMPEGVAEAGMPSGVVRSKQRMAEYTPEQMLAKYKEVAGRFGEVTPAAMEKLAREEAWRHGYGRMSDHYWKQFKHLVGESVTEAEYQGRQVQLGKPTSGDVKKYKVYVRDPKSGNIKKVNFGDKNMEIKRDNPERRKNFRARHNCSDKKDRTKAGYWSCRMWSKKPVSKIV